MSILPFRRPDDLDPDQTRRPDPADDERVMALVARRDLAAFDELVRRYWGPVTGYAGRILNDRDAGKDVAQVTFVRVWQRRAEWRDGSVRGYLFLLARNLCYDHVRQSATRARLADRVHDLFVRPVATPDDQLDAGELRRAIDRAVQALSPRRREAFILVHLRGLSYQEAADVMGVARATLSNQVGAALEQLRSQLRALL